MKAMKKIFVLTVIILCLLMPTAGMAATGTWQSATTGAAIGYKTTKPAGTAAKDVNGKPMTIVYLENLSVTKI